MLAACGGGGSKPSTVKKPVGPAVDEKTAESDAKGLAQELLGAVESGKRDNVFTLLDDGLIVFGPHKANGSINRSDALVALAGAVDPKAGKKLALRSTALDVVASNGGRSAWAFDLVSVDGEPHAITAVLVNTNDLWQVEAASIAFTPSHSTIKGELTKDAIVPPGAAMKSKIAPEARGAVDRFQKGLLDQDLWGADLTSRSEAVVIGPAAGEVARGKADVKKLWKKRVDAKTRAVTSGDVIAATTPDGQIAWVSAPITRVAEGEEPTPLRAFAVFEKAGANDWKLIALHESLAIDQPGSGAPFKKILPPMPAKDPLPEEKPADKDKTAKKDDKSKKKDEKSAKKKKKSDDDDKPKKVAKKKAKSADDEEDDKPKKKTKKKSADDEEDDKPKKKFSKKKAPSADEDEDKPKKKKASSDDEDDKPKKKTKKKPVDDDEEDDAPKKKKKKSADDDE